MSKHVKEVKALPAPRRRFPQFTRFFPASFSFPFRPVITKGFYWSVVAVLLAINTLMSHPSLGAKVTQPQIRSVVSLLSKTNASVLGAQQSAPQPSTDKREFGILMQQYTYWQDVAATHPDYRDAYYMLALIAYKMNRLTDAKSSIQRLLMLDPNYAPAHQLQLLVTEK